MSEAIQEGPEEVIPEETPEPVVEAAAPEPEVEPDPAPVPTVPLAALNEERHKSREMKQKLSAMEQELQSLRSVKEQVDEMRRERQASQQKDQFQSDPLGAIRKEISDLKTIQETAQNTSRQREQEQASRSHLERTVVAQVQEFSKANTDYPEALNYMLTTRAKELELLGAPPDQIEYLIEQESIQLAQGAVQRGENPAERVYNLAKLRGYAPKAAEKPKAVPNIETIDKGQKASGTLAAARGQGEEVSILGTDKMSDKEFDSWWDENISKKNAH